MFHLTLIATFICLPCGILQVQFISWNQLPDAGGNGADQGRPNCEYAIKNNELKKANMLHWTAELVIIVMENIVQATPFTLHLL